MQSDHEHVEVGSTRGKEIHGLWVRFDRWLFSKGELERQKKDAVERLQMSIRVTAKCRYNAASRLQRQGKFAFFATTILSLGLIFIPLMQNSGVTLAFPASVLNMMSIFLAVAVLVYSVVIGTARYEVRAENLNECGDKLKELNRLLGSEMVAEYNATDVLTRFQERYSDIVTDTENHSRRDYVLAMLEMRRDYAITGISRLTKTVAARVFGLSIYLLPMAMLLIEILFISDMVGATEILSPYLNGAVLRSRGVLPNLS